MNTAFKEALGNGYIEPAMLAPDRPFVIEGVQYYQATDSGINMAMGRFHSFSDLLRKHDTLKISDELLTTALSTMRDQLRTTLAQFALDPEQAQDNIRFALTTIERLQQRREFGLDVAQVYDIASMWFFSDQEDPAVVDAEVNRKKVASWLKHSELYAFFLSSQVGRFVPLKALASVDTLISIQTQNQLEFVDLKITSLKSQQFGLTSDTIRTIGSRMETLENYDGFIEQQLATTTITSPPGSAMNSAR